MRVTFLTTGLETGGAEYALLRLAPALSECALDCSVVSLRSLGTVGPLLQEQRVPVTALGLPEPRAMLRAPAALARVIRQFRPDLLHGWMYHGNIAATIAGRLAGVPVAWGIRQSLGLGTRDKWLTRQVISAGAMLSSSADLIVYNSAAARRQHEQRGYASSRAFVMPNGFDTNRLLPRGELGAMVRRELGIAPDVPVVGKVARFHPAKDYPTFLRAAALVSKELPLAVFVLAGEGVEPGNPQLSRLASELGLMPRLRLLGCRDDVGRLMAAFNVLCLTSSGMEGFPNAVGEAMSCGVPCVGTAVGDVAELIGDTGEVVRPADPGAVAAAVLRLLSLDPQSRRDLGARARSRIIAKFSIGEVARRYAELLRGAVSARA